MAIKQVPTKRLITWKGMQEILWKNGDIVITKNTHFEENNVSVDYSVIVEDVIRFDFKEHDQAMRVGTTLYQNKIYAYTIFTFHR